MDVLTHAICGLGMRLGRIVQSSVTLLTIYGRMQLHSDDYCGLQRFCSILSAECQLFEPVSETSQWTASFALLYYYGQSQILNNTYQDWNRKWKRQDA